VVVFHVSLVEDMPRLDVKPCIARKDSVDAMSQCESVGHDSRDSAIKEQVMIGTKHNDVAQDVGSEMGRAQRSQVVSLRIALRS
jgi:hypothetical protein